ETLAEAHTSAAYISTHYYRNWRKAETEYERAIHLNPEYLQAYFWLASLLVRTGRFDEAILQIKKAQKLDPLSLPLNRALAKILYLARRYDEAIKICNGIIEIDPHFGPANGILGMIYRDKEMYKEALVEINKLIEFSISEYHLPELNNEEKDPEQNRLVFSTSDPEAIALAGQVYALSGNRSEAVKLLTWLEELAARRYVEPHAFALIYAGLGENDKAFAFLEKSYDDSSAILTYFKVWSFLDPIRSDPRFNNLLQRIGFFS
ncbi:MAG: tetratricopeptide repeat protein, partial [Pyrinomonadaceae bacterium]